VDDTGLLRGSFFNLDDGQLEYGFLGGTYYNYSGAPQLVSQEVYNDNQWHFAALTYGNGTEALYVDGSPVASQQNAVQAGYNSPYTYFIGTGDGQGWANLPSYGWDYFGGDLEEVEVSANTRSSDWLQAEYFNQSSPSTFATLLPEVSGNVGLSPLGVTLYAGQYQQFSILNQGLCGPGGAVWSMPAGSPGTLSADGLYTAPNAVDTKQTVQITATTLGSTSTSVTATVTLMPPVTISVTPSSVTLGVGQMRQFAAVVSNTSNTAVTWTISPAGAGTVNSSGTYTAPATITVPQTVTITATSIANLNQSASATISLSVAPPVLAVTVNPVTTTLYGGQTQQFSATVTNSSNSAVTWSLNPAGAGTVDSTGFYTAPASVTAQQSVTITATSLANPSQSGSATITLAQTACMASGYGYTRQIVIDHNQVPNTDQANFPFLFGTTDPLLATTANGGHVANANGYDMIFSTDPNGLTALNYEMEQYNPVTGQAIAWIQIPNLSHTSDTVIYLFYGNPNVTTLQQNPTATWDSTYQGVWHLPNGTTLSANDSTVNANNGTITDATPTQGQIDGGAAFNGSTSQIICGSNVPGFQFTSQQSFTDSAWVNLSNNSNGWMSVLSNSRDIGPWHGLWIDGTNAVFGLSYNLDGPAISTNAWHYMVAVQAPNSGEFLYVDGALVASYSFTQDANGGGTCYIGNDSVGEAFQGSIDEVRIASAARSSDWIAAEYNNQSSPSTFFTFSPENTTGIAPNAVTLYSNQSQQFTAPGMCGGGVSYSLSSGAPGSLTPGGLYTAPSIISTQQTITVTAASQANSAAATITLEPSVSVSVTPASVTLMEGQIQQFVATVSNSVNPAVTWTISPAGLGTIDENGNYTSPVVTTQQTVTVTATSQQDTTKSASAMVTIAPAECASIGYGYQRVIVIDHTKVANTDQLNFPILFNTTDPDLASANNGGHVANPSGYDIIFSLDPGGATKLDSEIEQYNPANGQLVAWIRIPTLSHTTDTLVYVFYGNPNVTTPQQNPAGVWNSNYTAVYHMANTANGTADDSTNLGNNAVSSLVTDASGQIDGAGGFNGSTSYVQIPNADFPSYPTGVYDDLGLPGQTSTTFAASFGVWFNSTTPGVLLAQVPSESCSFAFFGICFGDEPTEPGYYDPAGWSNWLYLDDKGYVVGAGASTSTPYDDNHWHYAAVTYDTNGTDTLYVDGTAIGSSQQQFPTGYSPAYNYFVGTGDTLLYDDGDWNWLYVTGTIDEVTVASEPWSADWIQTQFNNQSSPSTFYKFTTVSTAQVVPSTVDLFASQTQHFAVTGSCSNTVVWSLPASGPGSLTTTGLYTAPSIVSGQQSVAINASSAATGLSLGTATITLLPPPQAITLTADGQQPYQQGTTQSFVATVLDQQGNPQIGVTVAFAVTGANQSFAASVTNGYGLATYTYDGANTGSDTIQASASINGVSETSNAVSVSWVTPSPVIVTAGVTLEPPPSLGAIGLVGAFTDGAGTVIEPVAIGASPREFIVPAGATQLQLGVNSEYYPGDGGTGFVVAVDGNSVTVPATAMPWTWNSGGQNTSYQYGIYNPGIQNGILDGSAPVVAATNLTAGSIVTVTYQSGLASANLPVRPLVNADGDLTWQPGTEIWQGTYFPTLYLTPSSYPLGQPITFSALVVDSNGAPQANVPVSLAVSGVNPQQLQATTDATGTVVFLYSGANAGTDSLIAEASPANGPTYTSSIGTVTWVAPVSSLTDTLNLSYFGYVNNVQDFILLDTDSSGNPVTNANVQMYVWGVDTFNEGGTTDLTGRASFGYYHNDSGPFNLVVVQAANGTVTFSNVVSGTWNSPATTTSCNFCDQITASISAQSSVTLPNPLVLTATVTDNIGLNTLLTWSQVSGPGSRDVLRSAERRDQCNFHRARDLCGSALRHRYRCQRDCAVHGYGEPARGHGYRPGMDWLSALRRHSQRNCADYRRARSYASKRHA
jgi:hypothetical protein